MYIDSELKEVHSFPALNDFVVELDLYKRSVNITAISSALWTLRTEQDIIKVVGGSFRTAIFERSPLSFDHEDDEYQVTTHVDDRNSHHSGIFGVVFDEDQEGDHFNKEVQAPEKLVGIPLF